MFHRQHTPKPKRRQPRQQCLQPHLRKPSFLLRPLAFLDTDTWMNKGPFHPHAGRGWSYRDGVVAVKSSLCAVNYSFERSLILFESWMQRQAQVWQVPQASMSLPLPEDLEHFLEHLSFYSPSEILPFPREIAEVTQLACDTTLSSLYKPSQTKALQSL